MPSASDDDELSEGEVTENLITGIKGGKKGKGRDDSSIKIRELHRTVSVQSAQELLAEQDRGNWGKHIEFMLACVGYAVGLGNVWRFPYITYKNGGGAFLIPYFSALVLAGLPLFFMELALGQYVSLGPVSLFKRLMPALQGIGIAMVIISFLVCIYYNFICGWILFYMFSSLISIFQGRGLEWQFCDLQNGWNSPNCYTTKQQSDCTELFGNDSIFYNFTCYMNGSKTETNFSLTPTRFFEENFSKRFASYEYFDSYVLDRSEGAEIFGRFNMNMFFCLLSAWVLVFLCLMKGVKGTGKVLYFTSLFPYVVLVGLFAFGLTLDGAMEGIKFYISPNFSKLKDFEVWKDAFSQIFYSVGVGFGTLITMSSYNKYSNNCMRDAIIVAFVNCMTSFFSGFVIFSFLGYMAYQSGRKVTEVVQDGTGLTFVAYPEAFSQLANRIPAKAAAFISFIFFFMLLMLGLDSQFAMVETVTTALFDTWPRLRKRRLLVILAVCAIMNAIGVVMCFQNGVYFFKLFDNFSASWGLLMLAMLETLLVSVCYRQEFDHWTCRKGFKIWFQKLGVLQFWHDLSVMINVHWIQYLRVYWVASWSVVSPLCLMVIFIATLVTSSGTKYEDYTFPRWAEIVGWCLALLSVMCIPGFLIYRLFWVVHLYQSGKIRHLGKSDSEVNVCVVRRTQTFGNANGTQMERKGNAKGTQRERKWNANF